MKKQLIMAFFCVAWTLTASAQQTVESIRKEYQDVKEWIARMSNDFPSDGIPPEYYDLQIRQNLPGTGLHKEDIRMFYGELEPEEEGDPYPPHYLRFATSKYNFAAREFYEEFLYDDKGQVMFIYAQTPDVTLSELWPYELRMWFDGKRLIRFMAKKAEKPLESIDIPSLRKATFKEEYTGKTIPEKFRDEAKRCQQSAQRFLAMFKGIDDNN